MLENVTNIMQRVMQEHKETENELIRIILSDLPRSELVETFNEFYESYLLEHIANEEYLIGRKVPEQLKRHRQAHDSIKEAYKRLMNDLVASPESDTNTVLLRHESIMELIRIHRLEEDVKCFGNVKS